MNDAPALERPSLVVTHPLLTTRVTLLTAVFAATLFLSASLLFVLEPMFAKMVLPYFGGSPAVWNTCVMFFQAAMLAGYGYAHLVGRWLPLRGQAVLHVALVLAAGFTLPVAIADGWIPSADGAPVAALLVLLVVSLGGPFFVVSSTAPLLQRWFSRTDDPLADDPYFLYAASNLGSIVALAAYPFAIEPRWPLSTQSALWTAAYVAFAVFTAICAAGTLGRTAVRRRTPETAAAGNAAAGVQWSHRALWVTLAGVPSSLLLGVTTFLSTDIAAMPLLWTIPLGLYLLTFVIAFGSRHARARFTPAMAGVLGVVLIAATLLGLKEPAWLIVPLHLAGFFTCALALHGRLADVRPSTHHLTEFYFWIALGGLAGGVFNTLLSPAIFSTVLEYPLALALAVALRAPGRPRGGWRLSAADVALPLALAATVTTLSLALQRGIAGAVGVSVAAGVAGVLLVACARRPLRLGSGLALVIVVASLVAPSGGEVLHAERTFFGVLRVTRDDTTHRQRLFHGSTLHGEQSTEAARRSEPLTYYHRSGPIGQVVAALSGGLQRVAVVGLGAGSLAAYAGPGQRWTFFELDPAVERIARSPEYFTYLTDCGARCDVVLGDARLSLALVPAIYDFVVLDAFSSDAIPAHLVTREAMALYLSRLSADGAIAFHISNRHLDLRPVIGSLAADHGLVARVQLHRPEPGSGASSSLWVVAARHRDALRSLATDARWIDLTSRSARVWTDDYSDILSILGTPR